MVLATALTRVEDLTRRTLVSLSRDRPDARPRPDGDRLRFIFTIDTEISMGGAKPNNDLQPVGPRRRIWAETDDGAYGITRFMDIFDAHGVRGVFFFEGVARHVVGEEELAKAARCIVERGHDVELHLHPEYEIDIDRWRTNGVARPSKYMFTYSLDEQRRYIRETGDALERWSGRRPIAFRAGGYTANQTTMQALDAEGLSIDSSYNRWAIGEGLCAFPRELELNDAAIIDHGILEIPVTNLKTYGPRGGLRPMELSSLNVAEMVATVEQLYEAGARVCCAVTHSFRLVRTRDVQYRNVAVDWFNIHRIRALCRYLKAHQDRFEVCTFRDLPLEKWRRDGLASDGSAPYYPTPPLWSSLSRLALQGLKERGAL